jgi:hypothetical protein
MGMDIEQERCIRPGRTLQGEQTVAFAAGLGHDPSRNLPLQHDHQAGEEVVATQQTPEDCGTHRIGKVGSHLPGRFGGQERAQILCQGINVSHFQTALAESLDEGWHQIVVDLEGEHTVESLEQMFRQSTSTRPDLEHACGFGGKLTGNSIGDRSIDQKVLTEATAFRSTHDTES